MPRAGDDTRPRRTRRRATPRRAGRGRRWRRRCRPTLNTATSLPPTSTTTLPPSGHVADLADGDRTAHGRPSAHAGPTRSDRAIVRTDPHRQGRAMLEVEVKYRAADRDRRRGRLAAGRRPTAPPRTEADQYFNAPDRDFRRTDEAFRLRRIGPRTCSRTRGRSANADTKTRTEIEVAVADGDRTRPEGRDGVAGASVTGPVAVVRKTRRGLPLHPRRVRGRGVPGRRRGRRASSSSWKFGPRRPSSRRPRRPCSRSPPNWG